MDGGRWARRLFVYIHLKNVNSTWRKRVTRLGTKFGIFSLDVEPQTEREWVTKVRERVQAVETERWLTGMKHHPTMHLYASLKTEIAPLTICGNTMGSRLLIEARGGALRTRLYRSKYDNSVTNTRCSACEEEDETIPHLLLSCKALLPVPLVNSRIEQALGFTNEQGHVTCSKRRLEAWWKLHR